MECDTYDGWRASSMRVPERASAWADRKIKHGGMWLIVLHEFVPPAVVRYNLQV